MKKEWVVVLGAVGVVGSFAAMCIVQAWRVYKSGGHPVGVWNCTELHDPLYKAYDKVAKTLYDAEIQHWGVAGTALGAMRHKGIIPWDDDIDIGIWKSDLPEAEKVLREAGHTLTKMWWGVKVDDVVDIFPFRTDGSYSSKKARLTWPRENFRPESLKSFKRVPFGPTRLTVVSKVEDYLTRAFGEDWSTHCVVKPPHEIGPFWSLIWRANPLVLKDFRL